MSGRRDFIHPPKDQLLKVASHDLVREAGGTTDAGEITGSRQQRMSDCGNRNMPDFLRIDEVAKLEDVTQGQPGWPLVTRALAKRQNCILFHAPPVDVRIADYHRALGHAAREYGEATGLFIEALSDGQLTLREVSDKRIVENIDEAIEQLLRLRALALAAPDEGANGQ